MSRVDEIEQETIKVKPFHKRDFMRTLKEYRWEVEVDDIDLRRDDCTLWYGEGIILKLVKGNDVIYLVECGDIRIEGKRPETYFIWRGGKERGRLTPYLREHGEWWANNWLEFHTSEDWDSGEIFYSLRSAVENIGDYIRRKGKG